MKVSSVGVKRKWNLGDFEFVEVSIFKNCDEGEVIHNSCKEVLKMFNELNAIGVLIEDVLEVKGTQARILARQKLMDELEDKAVRTDMDTGYKVPVRDIDHLEYEDV